MTQVSTSDTRWLGIDEALFNERILYAIKATRDKFALTFPIAIDLVTERIHHLKSHCPERFNVPLDSYGNDVLA